MNNQYKPNQMKQVPQRFKPRRAGSSTMQVCLVCVAMALTAFMPGTPDGGKDNRQLYQQAITNAMSPNPEKVYKNLIPINAENTDLIRKTIQGEEYLLVVSWKNDTTYYKPDGTGFYNTGNYPIWISVVPQLLEFEDWKTTTDVGLRLKQLLGLPPNSEYKYFVEFWVRPADLFRPCPDKEISDSQCELCFPSETDAAHKTWINENRISRYYPCSLFDKYPWTQLGYTYDWSPTNQNHIGLSEFVIGKHKNIVIHKIYTTEEYLNMTRK